MEASKIDKVTKQPKQLVGIKRGPAKPRVIDIDRPGRMLTADIVPLLNISPATWYAGLKTGRYPPADGKDGQFTYWFTSTIRPLLEPKS